MRCGLCGSTNGASPTPSRAAWPRSPTWRWTAEPRGPSRSSPRTRPPSWPPSAASAWTATATPATPRGLAALATRASRYAVIDVGTNSVKFHVGERDPDGSWRTIVDRAELTRLGEGLGDQGASAGEPLERAGG